MTELSLQEVDTEIFKIMESVPFPTIGDFRDAMGYDSDLCCQSCYDYTAPFAAEWSELLPWLWLKGEDWRTVV